MRGMMEAIQDIGAAMADVGAEAPTHVFLCHKDFSRLMDEVDGAREVRNTFDPLLPTSKAEQRREIMEGRRTLTVYTVAGPIVVGVHEVRF